MDDLNKENGGFWLNSKLEVGTDLEHCMVKIGMCLLEEVIAEYSEIIWITVYFVASAMKKAQTR